MNTRHVCGVMTAGVFTCAMAAFAQTSQQAPTGSSAQSASKEETPITLVGCLQRESDYRREHSLPRGGAIRTGIGAGDEFVLINASVAGDSSAASSASTDTSCASGSGDAYELTGGREHELTPMAGRRVQITGMLKPAKLETDTAGTSGTAAPRPTGGFDPLGGDLRLREVNVTSFGEVAPASRPTDVVAAPSSPEPPSPSPQAPEPVATTAANNELPRTASPIPLTGLIGLLSFAGALGLRLWGRA
jgi:hypothetical protein